MSKTKKPVGLIQDETVLLPHAIADSVAWTLAGYFHDRGEKVDFQALGTYLEVKAQACYERSESFRKKLKTKATDGREVAYLTMFMRHWSAGWIKRQSQRWFDMLPREYCVGQPLPIGRSIRRSPYCMATSESYIPKTVCCKKIKALDRAVERAANGLWKLVQRPVEIRFDSNYESGGAWVKDNLDNSNAHSQLGISITRCSPEWIKAHRDVLRHGRKNSTSVRGGLRFNICAALVLLPYGFPAKVRYYGADYIYHSVAGVPAAIRWIEKYVDLTELNPSP